MDEEIKFGDEEQPPRIEAYEAAPAPTIEQIASENIAATPPAANMPEPPATNNEPIYVDINAYENSYKMAQSDNLKVDALAGEAEI